MSTYQCEEIFDKIGCGPWTWTVFIFTSTWGLVASMQALSSAFFVPDVDYNCTVGELQQSNWTDSQKQAFSIPFINDEYSKCYQYNRSYSDYSDKQFVEEFLTNSTSLTPKVKCLHWTYDNSIFESTVSSEWDLVCDKMNLKFLVQSIFMVGFLIGAPLGGYLSDRFGRKLVIKIGFIFCIISSITASFMPSLEAFLFLRFLIGVAGYSAYQAAFVLAIECSPSYKRGVIGLAFCIPFALGYMILPGIAYFVRNWRILNIILSVICIPYFINIIVLPESPRWLLQRGKVKEAKEIIKVALKRNGKPVSDCWMEEIFTEIQLKQTKESADNNNEKRNISLPYTFYKHCAILIFIFFTATLVYYGVSLNSSNLNVDPFLHMFLGGLAELPCYTIIVPFAVMFGRRPTLLSLFCACALSILIPILATKDMNAWYFIAFNSFAKMCITAAFQLIFLYSSELFPTTIRSQGVGIANLIGRTGAIVSPFVNGVLGKKIWFLPNVIFGITCIASGFLLLLLPETSGRPLPESNEDVKKIRNES